MFSILARSAEEVPAIAERVDSLFRDSTAPTRTESEKAFVLNFFSMVGDVRLLINAICGVVILTVVLVASNSMAMSIRERVREVGVMKVLGFRKIGILSLLVGESALLGLIGALIGVYGARAIFSRVKISSITAGFVQRFYVNNDTVLICVGIGIFVGAIAATIPAWLVARKPIADALR
jgi:putative ABC transport system permease protein